MYLQRTIRKPITVEGIGLHTGESCALTFKPAPAGTGVYFVRADLPGRPALKAHSQNVKATSHATTLGGDAFSVATVEHCLSAVAALGIDNLILELTGPEIPIGDGSADLFFQALTTVGFLDQDQPRKYLYVTQPIYYGDNEKHAYVQPYQGLRISVTIEFPHPSIGRQKIDLDINETSFAREMAHARTFGFMKDVEALKERGLARGGSLKNAIVLDQSGIVNPEGLRFQDEFVRHKALDALGDLVTLGLPLMGHVVLYKAGHDIMNRLVRKILDSEHSYRLVELGGTESETLEQDRFWIRS